MTSYYIVFGVIVALAAINYLCLFWILRLQNLVKAAESTAKISHEEHPSLKPQISPEKLAELNNKIEKQAEAAIEQASTSLKESLDKSLGQVGQNVGDLSDKIIQDELTKYQNALEEVRQASVDKLSEVQASIDKRRSELEEALTADVAAEKAKVLERFDKQIGEIVSAYLIEALGSGVDLGAQSSYIMATLEQNKAEIIKALENE